MSSKRTSNGSQPQVVTWSHEEDKCLARAWCAFREDFKDTDPRKISEFWDKVASCYNENRPKGTQLRSWDAVNTHCFHMMLDVNLLSKLYEKCDTDRASGQSVDDVLEVALGEWCKKYSKDFKYAHVWKLMTELEIDLPQRSDEDNHVNKKSRTSEWKLTTELERYYPQQSDHRANMKSRTTESCSRTSSDSEVRFCAIEQQRAKRQDEIKVKPRAVGKANGGKRQQMQEERMKQKEIKLMHKDFDIVMMDTNGMTDAQREVHRKFVEQIRARRNW